MNFTSVNKLFEASFRANWDRPAISNYQGETYHYRDLARKIEKLHIMFEECGLEKGDKVAICSRNQANWAISFLATMTYGAVPVPLMHEFKPSNIHHLVNHSESKVLFVDGVIWENITEVEMPDIQAIIQVDNFGLLYSANEGITNARARLNELFGKKYPMIFTADCLNYYEDKENELAIINYTSGTSGFSKGVMIPYRAIASNLEFGRKVLPQINNTSKVVSMLPCAHMYGLMFEVLYELSVGCHVHFLSRLPSPKIIMQALSEVKPNIVIAVPLIIEKIYKNKVKPVLEKAGIKFALKVPVLDKIITDKIKNELINAFGGEFYEVIIGGAAFNKEVESFFKKMGFPFTVGYGMTECAPIITYSDWKTEKLYSCGEIVPNMEMKIDSPDPQNIPGELLVRGANVFLGYYKNPEATEEVLDEDGWLRTGDMGIIESIDTEERCIKILFDDEKYVDYSFDLLKDLELAYAITVHKSQGSEFPIVVIPIGKYFSRLMNKNLFYTAVTRARDMVVLVGSRQVVGYMVKNTSTSQRYTALYEKLCLIKSIAQGKEQTDERCNF